MEDIILGLQNIIDILSLRENERSLDIEKERTDVIHSLHPKDQYKIYACCKYPKNVEIKKYFRENTNAIDHLSTSIISTSRKNHTTFEIISFTEFLSEEFIYYYKNKLHWIAILVKNTLSEDVIRDNIKHLHLFVLCYSQKLSLSFIKDYINKIPLSLLFDTTYYSDTEKKDIIELYKLYGDLF